MKQETGLSCQCGATQLRVTGAPIVTVECCCTSCRTISEKVQQLAQAPHILTEYDATPYVLYRKDRVQFAKGLENLKELRVTDTAKTRRVVATCCNTPVFTEFAHGHWYSLFATLWPEPTRPALQMRTMAADLLPGKTLPDNVPNAKRQSFGFFVKLLVAWVKMGFRTPKAPKTERLG